jgi:acetylornithine deacetylase
MADAALIRKLEAAVEANWEKQVAWLQDLVRFPSVRGKEGPCQDWLAREMAGRGWSVDRYTLSEVQMSHLPGFSPVMDTDYSQAVQVVGTVRSPEQKGKSLIVQGHVDVVPPGPEAMWQFPPFDPVISGEWMNGRGCHDMKQGVAAMFFAMDALRSVGLAPAADVYVQTVTEEECTGNGALSTLARGYRADAALVPAIRDRAVPDGRLTGAANLLVMPGIDAANIAFNLAKAATDGLQLGPLLLGMKKPVHVLVPSVTARGILNLTALAVAEANRVG